MWRPILRKSYLGENLYKRVRRSRIYSSQIKRPNNCCHNGPHSFEFNKIKKYWQQIKYCIHNMLISKWTHLQRISGLSFYVRNNKKLWRCNSWKNEIENHINFWKCCSSSWMLSQCWNNWNLSGHYQS